MSMISGGGGEPGQQFLLVQNNNIIERVVQSSIGKGQSFTYREPQQIEYAMQEEHMQLQEDSDGGGSTSSGAGGDRVYSEDLMQQSEKGSSGGQQKRGGMVVDDKKMRRQIANSNERRRMQSINAGFQSLRNQLPHHEGEKLSKAAILQQTSEYIYSLEQERTTLLSQNCYLKRLLAQNDVVQDLPPDGLSPTTTIGTSPAAGSALVPTSTIIVPSSTTTTTAPKNGAGNKKRKMDPVTTIQAAVSDSSDEGLGSMSPEPFTLVISGKTTKKQQAAALAAAELKQQQQNAQAVAELERSQQHRQHDMYTEVIHGSPNVVTEIVEPCVDFEIDIDSSAIEETIVCEQQQRSVSAAPLPKKKRVTVESVDSSNEMDGAAGVAVVNGQITKIFRDLSDMHGVGVGGPQEIQELQVLNCDSELVLCSAFSSDSAIAYEGTTPEVKTPQPLTIIGKLGKAKVAIIDGAAVLEKKSKLQPLLESFNKVENKVEVERISSSPVTMTVVKEEPGTAAARAFLGASTSRQNLETIVEAIRHLEGDRFGEQPKNGRKNGGGGVLVKTEVLDAMVAELPTQEVPLALTTKSAVEVVTVAQRQAELSQFVHFKTKAVAAAAAASSAAATGTTAATTAAAATSGSGSSSSSSSSSAMPKLVTTTAAAAAAGGSSSVVTVNGQAVGATTTIVLRQLQQCRPGVIVAKQSS